jgi:hypothetical protein
LYCVANRPLTAAYCLNAQEMLGFRKAFDARTTDAHSDQSPTTGTDRDSLVDDRLKVLPAYRSEKKS